MAKSVYITQDKLNDLKKEMSYLKNTREKEIAEQIQNARSFGDLSENSEYDEAKNDQGKLYARIAEIESIFTSLKRFALLLCIRCSIGLGAVIIFGCLVKESRILFYIRADSFKGRFHTSELLHSGVNCSPLHSVVNATDFSIHLVVQV